MNRKHILLLIVASLAILLVAFAYSLPTRLTPKIVTLIREQAEQAGFVVNLVEPKTTYVKFRARKFSIRHKNSPFPIEVENLEIKPALLSLLTSIVRVNFKASPYLGALNGEVQFPKSLDRLMLNASLSNAQISKYEPLFFFQLQGLISAQLVDILIEPNSLQGEISLDVKEAGKPAETYIPKEFIGGLSDINIPKIENLSIEALIELKNENFLIRNLQSQSSLASLQASGKVQTSSLQSIKHIESIAQVSLAQETMQIKFANSALADWLPLLSNGSLQKSDSSFEVHYSGNPRKARIEFNPS